MCLRFVVDVVVGIGFVVVCLFVCSVNNILSTWRRLCLITVHNAHASVYLLQDSNFSVMSSV